MISIPYNKFCCYQHFQTSDSKSGSPVSCRICLFLHSLGNGYIFVMFEIMACRRVHKQKGTSRPCHSVTNVSIFLAAFFSFRSIFFPSAWPLFSIYSRTVFHFCFLWRQENSGLRGTDEEPSSTLLSFLFLSFQHSFCCPQRLRKWGVSTKSVAPVSS